MENNLKNKLAILERTLSNLGLNEASIETSLLIKNAGGWDDAVGSADELSSDDTSEPKSGWDAGFSDINNINETEVEQDASSLHDSDGSESSSTPATTPNRDYTLYKGKGSKDEVKKLQRLLVKSGFDLPRFGVDGIFGSETERAVISFKNKLKEDGRFNGPIDGSVDSNLMSLLDESASTVVPAVTNPSSPDQDQDVSSGQAQPEASGLTVYIGDSQMVGHLGKQLMSAAGFGQRFAKSSTRDGHWNQNTELLNYLIDNKPSKIIISLGGNGIDDPESFLNFLNDNTASGTRIIWSGAPPIQRKPEGHPTWANYLKSDSGFERAVSRRVRHNSEIRAAINSMRSSSPTKAWSFIDPFDHIKLETPLVINGKTYAEGYTCERCDGIHLPGDVASRYVSSISSLI